MANILLTKRSTIPIQIIREKWVYNLIKRRDKLKTCYSRRYNYRRTKYEDSKVIRK